MTVDMVEAEERRINERKKAAQAGKTFKGKENKDRNSSEVKSAGKLAFAEAKEKEDKDQAEQAEKEAAAKN
jgi:hypothetical protein